MTQRTNTQNAILATKSAFALGLATMGINAAHAQDATAISVPTTVNTDIGVTSNNDNANANANSLQDNSVTNNQITSSNQTAVAVDASNKSSQTLSSGSSSAATGGNSAATVSGSGNSQNSNANSAQGGGGGNATVNNNEKGFKTVLGIGLVASPSDFIAKQTVATVGCVTINGRRVMAIATQGDALLSSNKAELLFPTMSKKDAKRFGIDVRSADAVMPCPTAEAPRVNFTPPAPTPVPAAPVVTNIYNIKVTPLKVVTPQAPLKVRSTRVRFTPSKPVTRKPVTPKPVAPCKPQVVQICTPQLKK